MTCYPAKPDAHSSYALLIEEIIHLRADNREAIRLLRELTAQCEPTLPAPTKPEILQLEAEIAAFLAGK